MLNPGLALLALSGQVPVDRGAADAKGLGDLGGALAALPPCPGGGQLVRVHHGRTAAGAALRESGTFWGGLRRERHEIRCLDWHLVCRAGVHPSQTSIRIPDRVHLGPV